MQRVFYHWLLAGIIVAGLVVFSYHYIDRDVIYFFAPTRAVNRSNVLLKLTAEIPEMILSAIPILFFYIVAKLSFNKLSKADLHIIDLVGASSVAFTVRETFKFIFARYWADTFLDNNVSLLRDHVYGFQWFKSGTTYKSFPSGHMIAISVVASYCYMLLPKYRPYAISLVLMVATAQMILCYHYISDIIAGAFVGSIIGYYSYTISKTRAKISR